MKSQAMIRVPTLELQSLYRVYGAATRVVDEPTCEGAQNLRYELERARRVLEALANRRS